MDTFDIGIDIGRVTNLNSFNTDLTCKECLQILSLEGSKTCGTKNCSGQYCANCPVSACYACKQSLSEPLKKDLSLMLTKLIIKCKHENCRFSLQYPELSIHESNCGYKLIDCPKCLFKIQQKELAVHMEERCTKNIANCDKCQFVGRYIEDHSHGTVQFLCELIEENHKKYERKFNYLETRYKELENRFNEMERTFDQRLIDRLNEMEHKTRNLETQNKGIEKRLNDKIDMNHSTQNTNISKVANELNELTVKFDRTVDDKFHYTKERYKSLENNFKNFEQVFEEKVGEIVENKLHPVKFNESEMDIFNKMQENVAEKNLSRILNEETKITTIDNITAYLYLEDLDKNSVIVGTNKGGLFLYNILDSAITRDYRLNSGNVNNIVYMGYFKSDLFVSTGDNKSIHVFNISDSQPVKSFNHLTYIFSISTLTEFANKSSFAIGGNNFITLYTFTSENLSLKAKKIEQKDNFVFIIKNITDNLIVSGHENGNIRLWDIKHGSCTRSFNSEYKNDITHITLYGTDLFITCDKLNSDVKVWSINNESCLFTLFNQGSGYLVSMCVIKESDFLVCSYFDKTVKMFDLKNKREIDRIETNQVVSFITVYDKSVYKFARRFGGKELHFS